MYKNRNKNDHHPDQDLENIPGRISQKDGDQPKQRMDPYRKPGKVETKIKTRGWRDLEKKHNYL
jgi:hypothetical protein